MTTVDLLSSDMPFDAAYSPAVDTHSATSSTAAYASSMRDDFAIACFRWASHLTDPICKISTWTHRILTPLDLAVGKVGFCASKIAEIACRVILGIAIAFLAVPAALCGLAGIIARALGAAIRPNDFSYYPGKGKEKHLADLKDNTIHVQYHNVCMLAGSMCRSHGGMPEMEYRIKELVREITQSNTDVLCLAEVQDTKFLNILLKKLDSHFAHFYCHLGTAGHKSDSGLFIASKLPIDPKEFHFARFDDAAGSAKWINKGFASFPLVVDGQFLGRITATHAQHGPYPEVRTKQFQQIIHYLSEQRLKDKERFNLDEVRYVLAADTNIERDSPEDKACLLRHFDHGYIGTQPTAKNCVREIWNPKDKDPKEEQIDTVAIMCRTEDGVPFKHSDPNEQPRLTVKLGNLDFRTSDHRSLHAALRYRKEPKTMEV